MTGYCRHLPAYLLLLYAASGCATFRADFRALTFEQQNNGRVLPATSSEAIQYLADRAASDKHVHEILDKQGSPDYIAVRCHEGITGDETIGSCLIDDFIYVGSDRVIAFKGLNPRRVVDEGALPDDYATLLTPDDRKRLADARRLAPPLNTPPPQGSSNEATAGKDRDQATIYFYLRDDDSLSGILVSTIDWWYVTLDGNPVGKVKRMDKSLFTLKMLPGQHTLVANPSNNILSGTQLRPIGLTVNAEAGRSYFIRQDETTHSGLLLGIAVAAATKGREYMEYSGVGYFIHQVFELRGRTEILQYKLVDCLCGKKAGPSCGDSFWPHSCREPTQAPAAEPGNGELGVGKSDPNAEHCKRCRDCTSCKP
jgi:hypothetical protein